MFALVRTSRDQSADDLHEILQTPRYASRTIASVEPEPLEHSRGEWPDLDPEWRRLADTATRLLFAAEKDEVFRAVLPSPDDVHRPVAQHRAYEGIVELVDLAPDWAREANVATWPAKVVTRLIEAEPLKKVLAEAHAELKLDSKLIAAGTGQLPDGVTPEFPTSVIPCAVAAVAAARARAALLASGETPPRDLDASVLPSADLLLQARIVLAAEQSIPGRVHPYVVYELARASFLCATAGASLSSELQDCVRDLQRLALDTTGRLLAADVVVGSRPVHGVALAFCAATLALPTPREEAYIKAALDACVRAQQPNGAWAEGRALHAHADPDTGEPAVISSYDVALAAAQTLGWLSLRVVADTIETEAVVGALKRAVRQALEMIVHLAIEEDGDVLDGWVTDGTYGRDAIETSATMAVLRLAVTMRWVSEIERAESALAWFDLVWDPRRGDPAAPYLKWDIYIEENEPDAGNPILPSLHDWFVAPIREHAKTDPRPWAPARGKSLLLFGPPGTTKTTIVKAMAQGLGWPLVTLSPGTFIRDGLEHVERRAIKVFKELEKLSGVVVLFDECDELFRSREHTSKNENDQIRSISAFMTASMLPKLQDLRDRERIIFVIATNYFGQIDSAVKRIGRIDHIVGVSWPDGAQREHMIRTKLASDPKFEKCSKNMGDHAIKKLAEHTRYCIRGDVVELASKLGRRADEFTRKDRITKIVEDLTAKASPVEKVHQKNFRTAAIERSETHRAGQGELKE